MKVKEITVGMGGTFAIADYQNIKPLVSVTMEVGENENLEDIYEEAKSFCKEKITEIFKEVKRNQ